MDTANPNHGTTRRRALAGGLALGAGIALNAVGWPARARATPTTTPPASDAARTAPLLDAAALMALTDEEPSTLVALMPAEDFGQGHIPGTVPLDWPALEITDTSDASVARWQTEMAELFASLGAGSGRRVVTYDGGSLFATRPWWVLHYLGFDTVAVLDGGLPAWQVAGGGVVTGMAATPDATPPAESNVTTFELRPRPDTLATLAEVQASLEDPTVVFVDARTPEEYAAGHLPGAVNINYPRNARSEPPRRWLPQDELRSMYASAGITPDKLVIPYCATGVRSSVTYFTLHLIGYDNVSLFTGSWAEWSRHPDLPVTTGNAP